VGGGAGLAVAGGRVDKVLSASAWAPVLGHWRAEPSRTWSLIVTLFGDAVVPRGGQVWLGTALAVFEGLEIGGNVVRTAMSRLAADGWLERRRVGRNSFYQLAEKGREVFAEAAVRIYAPVRPAWDGAFRIAIAPEAAGFAALAPGVLIAAGPVSVAGAVLLRAETDPASARALAAQVWPTGRLGDGYRRFLAAFGPLAAHVRGHEMAGLEAMLARLLLIHAFRRLVLHDPMLPEALLEAGWPGHAARDLCAGLYRELVPASERWLDAHGVDANGRLPAPSIRLEERFRAG